MHKIGESTSHVRFNAKTKGLQITQEKLREGIKLSSLLKIPAFFFRHKYLSILEIGENLENHDDGRMKKKLNFS